jgi:putative membrane protein
MATIPPLTVQDRARIGEAVGRAELLSAGEIVTIVTPQSDPYRDVALAWAVFVAFLALAALELAPDFYLGLVDRVFGWWSTEWTPRAVFGLALSVAIIKFLGMLALQWWRPLRLWLVPGPIKAARVHARALTCFRVGAESRTTGRTGILIYLSMAERRAEIVADAAIAAKVSPDVWGDAMQAMLAEIRQGRVADGMVAAVERVGAVLAEHFPRAADDTNELPDRLIEV